MQNAITEEITELVETGMTKGTHLPLKGKRLIVYEGKGVCSVEDCITTLSRYNKDSVCFNHRPTKYPRVRGRVLK